MTIEFVLDISKNDDLICDFEGLDELDLRVDVEPYFDGQELCDLEIKEAEIYTSEGWQVLPKSLEEDVFTMLYYSDGFAKVTMDKAKEEAAEWELERRIQAQEDKRLDEALCWAGLSN